MGRRFNGGLIGLVNTLSSLNITAEGAFTGMWSLSEMHQIMFQRIAFPAYTTSFSTIVPFISSNTWTVPTDVTSIDYLVVAGGGGGGNNGGSGVVILKWI